MAHKSKNPLSNKEWKALPTESVVFDQTSGALAAVDTTPEEDPRIAQRTFEGAAITGIVGAGF
jgi:hypothetical protein